MPSKVDVKKQMTIFNKHYKHLIYHKIYSLKVSLFDHL